MKFLAQSGFVGVGVVMMACMVGCSAAPPPEAAMAPAPPPAPVTARVDVGAGYGGPGGYGQPAPAAPPGDMDAPAPPPPPPPASVSVRGKVELKGAPSLEPSQPADRPGLGTQWGETRESRISMVSFLRADRTSPFATAALFYNDDEGARAMASAPGFHRNSAGMFTIAGGLMSVGLRDEGHNLFSGFSAGGRSYAVGEAGRRYTIVLRNNTSSRLEVVVSVDGLDVLDGKASSFGKRGYIVDGRSELEIDGFRQSLDAVASFRFGSVRGSYAGQKTGDTRNVGVIGIALFNEEGTNPAPWTPDEVQRRRDANPFPGQFATPP